MDSLVSRGHDLEAKHHHNQLQEFKILRTRNHLFGLWAAHTLGLADDQQEILLQMVINPTHCTVKGDQVVQKVYSIFTEKGLTISESHLHKQLNYFYQDAANKIMRL